MAAQETSNPLRWLALLPLPEAALPDVDDVVQWYAQAYPDAPPLTLASASQGIQTYTLGGRTLAATLIPHPIPWEQLEGPCATAWYWPQAAETLREHVAHLLVVLVDEPGKSVDHALALTRVVAALAQQGSVGVFWGPGRLVHATPAFLEQARQVASDDLPLFLWIDFRIEEQAPGQLQLYTTGLAALGADELETSGYRGSAQALLEFAYNIGHFQLLQNKTLNEGDTLGLTDEVEAIAHREPSMLGGGMEVVRLEFAKITG
ncbi:MAG: DUF4261 domain-containing protein [Planctomycetales bacterium]|nr:DUF4261 domain-containing protein [Planctomycetales bacterium]